MSFLDRNANSRPIAYRGWLMWLVVALLYQGALGAMHPYLHAAGHAPLAAIETSSLVSKAGTPDPLRLSLPGHESGDATKCPIGLALHTTETSILSTPIFILPEAVATPFKGVAERNRGYGAEYSPLQARAPPQTT